MSNVTLVTLPEGPIKAAEFGTALKRFLRELSSEAFRVKVSGSTRGGKVRSPYEQYVRVSAPQGGTLPEEIFTAALDLLYPNRSHSSGMGNIDRHTIAIHGIEWVGVERLVRSRRAAADEAVLSATI